MCSCCVVVYVMVLISWLCCGNVSIVIGMVWLCYASCVYHSVISSACVVLILR